MLAACGARDPLEALQRGERGVVVRVIDGDALVLASGQTVRLAGIEAPAPARRDRSGEPFADEATEILQTLALGREVELYYGGLTRDRYDRAIAQARTVDSKGRALWLNHELARLGAARVRIYPDNEILAADLFAAETEARSARRGLWAEPGYSPKNAATLASDARGFVILEGLVVPAAPARIAVNDDGRQPRPTACRLGFGQIIVEVAPSAQSACTIPPGSPARLRGWVSNGTLRLESAANLEVLDAD